MRMDSKQNRQYYHSVHGDEDNNDLIDRRKCCAKPLGIQRCNSDGVLVQQNGCQKGRPTSKSSSEVSINGICEELVTQVDTNYGVSDSACAFATNSCIGNGSIDRKRANGIKKDILCRQQSSRESNIMANGSSTQHVEQRKPYSMIHNEARVNNIDESVLIGRVNGMNLNVDATSGRPDYLSNVCNTYRQEADILYGRTRGGINHTSGGINQNMVGIESNLPNGHENGDSDCSEVLVCHENHRSSVNDIGQSDRSNKRTTEDGSNLRIPNVHQNYLVVSAPLAVPENLSDDESASSLGNSENNTILRALELGQVEDELYEDNEMELMDTDVEGGVDRIIENGLNVSSHPVDVSNGANDDSDEISIENNKELPDSEHVSETEVTLQNEGNKIGSDNQEVENVQQVEEQTRSSSSSSLDSIDDIGDFIEADLPPNNDRLAFFARESSSSSTTDEDEGCGDEVLPNANEDEESENETIDPLTHAEQHNISGELITEKLLNNTSSELLSYSNDFTRSPYAFMNSRVEGTCNIFCNRSLEDNEGVGEDSDLPDLPHANLEASGYSVSNIDNITLPYSYAADNRNESLPKCENSCVSCDKPVDKSLQRKDEIGVVVCDKCFNERDFDKIRKSENVVRKKIRTVPHSSSTNRLSYRNSYCRTNSQDKVSNASHSSIGLSSSDSDPFERLYVSDSSEMVSPDVDTGVESVFPSSSTSSDGASVQYNQINCVSSSSDERRLPGSVGIHRQSVSLEYETPDEVLYCPYYTRRSRSLDQDLTLNGAANLSPDRDIPNISVTSSNFQDDESNNQEKVFDKRPYHVEPPIPTYSSSDEEENTRVPAPYLNHTDMQEENGAGTPSDMNSLIYMHHMSNPEFETTPQNIIVADEPIYEDIEDLQLLLEDRENDGDLDNRSTTQPLCHAISKLRRKKRSRSPVSDVEKVMIWNEYEAYVVQVKQIGTSACGPTAVLNVLKAFDFQVEKEEVTQKITSTMRMEAAPIPYYLFSRYSAGTTAQALVDGVCSVTRGAIRGRFFHFYPKRDVELLKWLGHWMKKGAVPVATLNLQRGVKPGWTIPDAWHHQMVYGVSSKGVYLTNPLEIVPESVILEQLTSDSILLVRKQDVVSRFRDWCPLNEILKQRDPRWMTMNVLGQIVHMLREQCMPQDQQSATRSLLTSHIRIPAAYKAGIILYMRSNSEHFNELMQTPELPLKKPSETES